MKEIDRKDYASELDYDNAVRTHVLSSLSTLMRYVEGELEVSILDVHRYICLEDLKMLQNLTYRVTHRTTWE